MCSQSHVSVVVRPKSTLLPHSLCHPALLQPYRKMYTAGSEPGRVDLGKGKKEGSWSAQAWVARGTSRGMGVPVECW